MESASLTTEPCPPQPAPTVHNDLVEYNGADAGDKHLPLAATYVINADHRITYAFLDANYRNRSEPADIVTAVQDLGNGDG